MGSRVVATSMLCVLAACSGNAREEDGSDDVVSALEFHGASVTVDSTMPDVDAIGYELELALEDATPGHETFRARAIGSMIATRSLDAVELDFDGNTIDEVAAGKRASALTPATYERHGGKLVVKLPAPARKGDAIVIDVRYRGAFAQADGANPNDFSSFGGLMVRQDNAEGKRIFTSLAWPSKARRFMPLRDHPRDGAMIAMKLTFPGSFAVVANGEQKSVVAAGASRTWSYEALTPMPPYDFHVAAYEGWVDHEATARSGVKIASRFYARDDSSGTVVMKDAPKALDFYEEHFGAYRFGKHATFLEEPIFGGGMEHASVVSLDETLFANPERSRHTAFHELAHHWSGNLVRIRTWNDFWLSEGFTDYLTARFVAANDGLESGRRIWGEYLRSALYSDAKHALRPGGRDEGASEIDVLSIFDDISYKKGARVLRMLESVVGERELTEFLSHWFERHGRGAATTIDFEKELSSETGKDLRSFFDRFVYGKGAPDVRVSWQPAGSNDIDVTVDQTGAGDASFPVEIAFTSAAGATQRAKLDVHGARTTKRLSLGSGPSAGTRAVVDPDDRLYGTTHCDDTSACKPAYACRQGACAFE